MAWPEGTAPHALSLSLGAAAGEDEDEAAVVPPSATPSPGYHSQGRRGGGMGDRAVPVLGGRCLVALSWTPPRSTGPHLHQRGHRPAVELLTAFTPDAALQPARSLATLPGRGSGERDGSSGRPECMVGEAHDCPPSWQGSGAGGGGRVRRGRGRLPSPTASAAGAVWEGPGVNGGYGRAPGGGIEVAVLLEVAARRSAATLSTSTSSIS